MRSWWRRASAIASTTPSSRCCRRSIRCSRTAFSLDFGQIGLITLRLPGDRVAAPARRRPLHRPAPAALFAAGRHGLQPDRARCSSRWRRPIWILLLAAGADRASAPRSSIPNPRGSPGWRRADGTASPSRCSRSAAMSARRSGRCSPPSSWCRTGRGSIAWFSVIALARRWRSCGASAAGTRAPAHAGAAPRRGRSA